MALRLSRRGFLAGSGSLLLAPQLPALAAPPPLAVAGPRAEQIETPLGLETPAPRLSWRLQGARRGLRQTAYRVRVASSVAALHAGGADLWDSGRVESGASTGVAYAGAPLRSRQRCHWQVTVWDDAGAQAESAPAFWEMGLLEPADWQAGWLAAEGAEARDDRAAGLRWIGGAATADEASRKFRGRFTLEAEGTATLIVSATRSLQLWLDGAPLTLPPDAVNPFVAAASAATLTLMLGRGAHRLEAALAPRRDDPLAARAEPELAALLRVVHADGRVQRLTTQGWETQAVAIASGADWRQPGDDGGGWQPAQAGAQTREPWPAEPAVLLRRRFEAPRPIVAARLYVTALGAYEAWLNGRRVGDALLTPESTDFRKRALYRVYDVGALLAEGANALGLVVGDGWYASYVMPGGRYGYGPAPRRVIAQLELEHADGARTVIGTGAGWTTAPSAILRSEIYAGEDYDARRESAGWSTPAFDDRAWRAAEAAPAPPCALVAQAGPPIRRRQMLRARAIRRLDNGDHVFDFGQNFAGWCRLRVRGAAGSTVTLRYAEILRGDGAVDQSNLRSARAADSYVLRGDAGGESWEPRFTYHGFRYVQVAGFPGTPRARDLLGIVVHSDLAETGRLALDNPLLQRLWQNTLWSQRSNFVGIPTDCPQRDERLGWMGDANVFWDAAAFDMDVAAFTRRFMGDVRDAQTAAGAFPDFAPATMPLTATGAAPGWADAGVTLPWTVWRRYGDTGVVDENWAAMQRYLAYILEHNPDHVWRHLRGSDYGDWLALDAKQPGDPTTPKDLVGTATWAHSADCMAQMAEASGRAAEAAEYRALHARITAAFQAAFVGADGTVGNGSQTGAILALRYGLVPAALRAAAAAKLVADIRRRGTLLSTGFLGTPNSLDVLAEAGESGLVYDLLLRTEYPGWGYMIAKGATTIWERWNGDTGDVAMNSYNHYALGAVCGFLFRRVAGIEPLEPGFRRFAFRPVLDARLRRGGGDYESVLGRIATRWTYDAAGFRLELEVPPNAAARVHLPATPRARVLEDGRDATAGRTDLALVARNATEAVLEAGAGRYRFAVR